MKDTKYLLDDERADVDELHEKTHEALADQLYKLITETSDSGRVVGLEGKWGSGKSTIVQLLRKKLQARKDSVVFCTDAWEHEGDPLRKMFLLSLVDELKQNDIFDSSKEKKLSDEREKVASKTSDSDEVHSSLLSKFGKYVSFLTLFVPVGCVIIDNAWDEVTFDYHAPIHWVFVAGWVLALAPVWAFVYQFFHWRCCRKRYEAEKKNPFSLFDINASRVESHVVVSETEKDSVAFAESFKEIIGCIKSNITRFVIVIDNLDRINHQDALKIWSTLQTFVQTKGNLGNIKLWIIIPYTEEGIKALWENAQEDKLENENGNINVGKSFLDKTFQLRLEVPDLLIGDWQAFARKKMEDIFADFSEADRKLILDMLCWARRNSADAPSPREIKLYLNQVKLLHSIHSPAGVSLAAICFYATLRFILGYSRSQIESDLREGKVSAHSLPLHSDNAHLVEDLCAILFHVPRGKGIQILLEGEIKSYLEPGKESGLKSLFETHGEAFTGVLGHILSHAPESAAFAYALAVQKGLASESDSFHDMAISHWRDRFPNYRKQTLVGFRYPLIVQFGSVVRSDSNLAKDTWKFFVPLFRNDLVENDYKPDQWLKCLDEANRAYGVATTVPYTPDMLPMLKQCGELNRRDEKRLSSLLELTSDAENQITDDISSGPAFDDRLPIAFSVLVDAGLQFVDNTFQALDQHFPSNGNRTDKYFQLIACFDRIQNDELRKRGINQFLHKVAVWDSMVNSRSTYPKNLLAYLIPKYLGSVSPSHVAAELHIRQEIVTNIVNRWKSTSIPDAESIYRLTSDSGDYSYLAMLADSTENQLVGDVIRRAIRDKDLRIAEGEEVFVRFVRFLKFVSSADKASLSALFVEAGDIVLEVENAPSSVLMPELSALQLLTDSMSEGDLSRIRSGLERTFASASREEWSQAFKESSSVIKLFNKLQNENSMLSLTNAFCEALKQWLSSLFENKETEDAPTPDGIAPLFRSLAPGFQEEVSVFVNQLARNKSFLLRPFEAELVLRFGAHDKWTEADGEQLCQTIQKAILNKDGETLLHLVPILNKGLDKFKPSDRFSSTLKEPVETWFKDASEEDRKNLSALCSSLHIQLDPPLPSCDNPKS